MKKKLLLAAIVGTAVGVGIYFGKKYLEKLDKELENGEDQDFEDADSWDDLDDNDFEDEDVTPVIPAPVEHEQESASEQSVSDSEAPVVENVQHEEARPEVKPERPWSTVNSDGNPIAKTTPTV